MYANRFERNRRTIGYVSSIISTFSIIFNRSRKLNLRKVACSVESLYNSLKEHRNICSQNFVTGKDAKTMFAKILFFTLFSRKGTSYCTAAMLCFILQTWHVTSTITFHASCLSQWNRFSLWAVKIQTSTLLRTDMSSPADFSPTLL